MTYYTWQQYLRRNPTWTISFQQSEDKRRTSTSIHKPFAASATGNAEITQVLEPKTRRLFICRFLSRRNDMHSGAVQPSVFLNTVIPLSISFPHSLLILRLLTYLCCFFRLLQCWFSRGGYTLYATVYYVAVCPIQVWCFKTRLIVDKTK